MDSITEVMQMLEEDNPSSFSDLPDGGYWVTLDREGTRDLGESFMLGWRVDGGEREGAACNDFLRWFSDDGDKQKTYRGITTGTIKAILPHIDEEGHGLIATGITELRNSADWQEAADAFETITGGMNGIRMPIRLVTGKTGFQNTRYTDRGGVPCDVEDPREIEAVSV